MKLRKGIAIAALVHLIIWSGILLFFVIGIIEHALFKPTNSMDMAISYMFTGFAGVGFVTGLLLFLSVRGVCRTLSAEVSPLCKTALGFSAAAMANFYVFIVLLLGINKDALSAVYLALAILWLACAVTGGALLLAASKKQTAHGSQTH